MLSREVPFDEVRAALTRLGRNHQLEAALAEFEEVGVARGVLIRIDERTELTGTRHQTAKSGRTDKFPKAVPRSTFRRAADCSVTVYFRGIAIGAGRRL